MYICVFVCPLGTGRKLGCNKKFRRRPGCFVRLVYVQIAGYIKGSYIYVVLIADLNWLLL